MTHDRYLRHTGRPQVYGTPFKNGADGLCTAEPFDPTAVTDAECAAIGSLPVAATYAWLEGRNAAIRAEREAGGDASETGPTLPQASSPLAPRPPPAGPPEAPGRVSGVHRRRLPRAHARRSHRSPCRRRAPPRGAPASAQ